PVVVASIPATWHWSSAVQVTVEVGLPQVPFWQVSPEVQAVLSLHVVRFALLGFEHTPVVVSHVPATWHWSRAVQVTVEVGLPQVPLWQVSPEVQALLSLHVVPFALFGIGRGRVGVSHVPAT